jgi:hypothetical protein
VYTVTLSATGVPGTPSATASITITVPVAPPAVPVDQFPPTIAGTTTQGQKLTETQGSWSNNPTGYAYQWQDCDYAGNNCQAIVTNANGQTYTLTAGDVGSTIRVQETASNASGPGTAAVSAATAVVSSTAGGSPVIARIAPSSGPPAGGTSVTVTGSGFTGATRVAFGGVVATSFSVIADSEITAVSPAQAAGAHHMVVTGPGGTSALVSADVYTYKVAAPAITGISPSSGPPAGGTSVTVTGSGFTGATRVAFGGVVATSFNVVSATQITAVSPAQTGAHYIVVTGPGGTSALVSADVYTYK